ncbi:hypothetical protein G5I_09524 [Acromyrmex echinatior]|uniref:Uncharacterized protein n=1 Tax=Acromyrmex echinatior TaxID=103372 RepID=F4WUF6_ACREC|nr:hypothetical protein G5I_09524 [Acromyrmex echinatior]
MPETTTAADETDKMDVRGGQGPRDQIMSCALAQTNLNHSAGAQNMLMHGARPRDEWVVGKPPNSGLVRGNWVLSQQVRGDLRYYAFALGWGVLLCVLPYIDVAATTLTSREFGDEPGSWSACSSAVLLRRQLLNNDMDTGNDIKRLGFGTQDRLTGGVVPAPGMSSSSDGLTAGLPTGPAVESATVRMEVVEEVMGAEEPALPGPKERAEPGAVSQSPLPQRRKELRLILDRTEVDVLAGASAEDSVASGSASPDGVLRRKRGRLRKKRYPKEMRIRVVAGEIVNSPVADSGSAGTPAPGGVGLNRDMGVVDLTLPACSDAGRVVDRASPRSDSVSLGSTPVEDVGDLSSSFEQIPYKGKKRGRKLKEVDFTLLASSDAGRVVDRAGPRSDSASLGSTPVEDAGDLSSSFEQIPYKGKKRGRKLKGSNAPGSHALTKISSKWLELEDDEWDREDFFKVSKKGSPSLKKRKGLVECRLDDRLSSSQKTAVEVTGLFPQMSPKSVVAETLRVLDIAGEAERRTVSMNGALRRQIKVGVNVAKIAVQRLVADITKCSGPSDEVRANNLALEREVIKLRREMDILRREKISLRDQVESLRLTVQSLRDGDCGRDRSPSSEGTVSRHDFPVSRRSRDCGRRSLRRRDYVADKETRGTGDLPPAYRPPLGGVRKRLEDVFPRLHKAGRVGQMDSSRVVSDVRRDSRVDKVNVRDVDEVRPTGAVCAEPSPPSLTYLANGEPWTVVGSKRARKRRNRKGKKDAMVGKPADSSAMPPPSTGVGDTRRVAAGGVAKTIRGSYAAVAGVGPRVGKVRVYLALHRDCIGSEVTLAGALRVELPPPPPTYPVDGEPWTEVGSKRARKRARKKKKRKKNEVLSVGLNTGTAADLDVVPPPSTGAVSARRVAVSGSVLKSTACEYAAAARVHSKVFRAPVFPALQHRVRGSRCAALPRGNSASVLRGLRLSCLDVRRRRINPGRCTRT